MFAVQSVESCACAVFFVRWIEVCEALGHVRVCGELVLAVFLCCVCVFLILFLFVGGVCGGWCVVASGKVFGVSVCVFPSIRHDRKVATHSSCSHFVRLLLPVRLLQLLRLVRLLTLVRPVPASPASPACPASGHEG